MLPFLLSAALLALATLRTHWVAMHWPAPRPDVLTGVTGAACASLWYTFNDTMTGPTLGNWPFTFADLLAVPLVLASSLLIGRTVLLSRTPHRPAPSPAPPAAASDPTEASPTPEAAQD